MSHVTFIYLLGLGGQVLDPSNGAALLREKVNALKGTFCPALLHYTDGPTAVQYIKEASPEEKLMLVGDSCGANRLSWVAAVSYPRIIDYVFAIQASMWCNLNCPTVPSNVKEFINVYGGPETFGLGQFNPPLTTPPTDAQTEDKDAGNYLYNGKTYIGNNGKTSCRYHYVNAVHPGDFDVINVQNPIVAKAQELIGS